MAKKKNDIEGLLENAKKIDWEKINKERAEQYKKDLEKYHEDVKQECDRVEAMECPCCKSTAKHRHHRTENNGIIGPGYHSRTIDDYYICQSCGVHYTDLNKANIQFPENEVRYML